MLEYLQIIAGSWPIAVMVVGLSMALIVNRRVKQAQEDRRAIYDLQVSSTRTVTR